MLCIIAVEVICTLTVTALVDVRKRRNNQMLIDANLAIAMSGIKQSD